MPILLPSLVLVYLADAEGLTPGDFVEVQIYDADGHDLWGGPPQD